MSPAEVEARRSIEALRAGVPSRTAAKRLGTTQEQISTEFRARLVAVEQGRDAQPLVIAANYGDGKSHLLEWLRSMAEDAGFVTAYLTVSPEMPPGRAQVVLRALVEAAEAPCMTGKALRTLTSRQGDGELFGELRRWAEEQELNDRFAALLELYQGFTSDVEFQQQILDDIEGKPMKVSDIRRRLKDLGIAGELPVTTGRVADQAHDRLRLFARLCRVCTSRGLVVFFDELERLAMFTRRQRFAAYQELGWWRQRAEETDSGVLMVCAMTRAFEGEVISAGKDDEQHWKVYAADLDPEQRKRGAAGLKLLSERPLSLQPPTPEQLADIQYRVSQLYGEAYGAAPGEPPAHTGGAVTLRQRIRAWITHWDMARHYPEHAARIVADKVLHDQQELPDGILADADESGA